MYLSIFSSVAIFNNKKYKSSTLIYAVFIQIFILIICGSLILLSFYNRMYVESIIKKDKLIYNANSGINILISKSDIANYNEKKYYSLFENSDDSVELLKKRWGIFDVFISTAKWKKNEIQKIALVGSILPDSEKIALFLTNSKNPLYVCGNTLIKGKCYLPEDGAARAYIEGKSFSGNKLVDGKINKSTNVIPLPNQILQDLSITNLRKEYSKDSIFDFEKAKLPDTIRNSFSERTLILYQKNKFSLQQYLIGNIIAISDNSIIVTRDCKANDIIICAPFVKIEKGFEGKLQVLASDSIVVEEECNLNYPSALLLVNEDIKDFNPFIRIMEKSKINGVVYQFKKNIQSNHNAFVYISKDVKINGQVYSNGMIEQKGTIYGSVYCNKFILKTPSSYYENHLLDATIDISKLSKYYVGAIFFNTIGKRKIVKWLY
ncbi:MAG: hypothetical protein WC223_10945 [Bacteroidales bacterium]|jgi:hypothetical protein